MSENKDLQVSNSTLFLHSVGSGVVGIKNVIFGTWVLLYYNQVLGLEPYLASIALGISLIFDAIILVNLFFIAVLILSAFVVRFFRLVIFNFNF